MTAASSPVTTADYSVREEIASSVIHGIGIVFGVIGLVILATVASRGHDALHVASVCIYGATLVALYVASTLYHSIAHPPAKPLLRVLDHSAIFLLIAGTYTPFTLIALQGVWGWSLFAIVWTLAFAGIALEVSRVHSRRLMAGLYVGMGWVGLIAIKPLIAALPAGALWFLFGGGVAYTLGVPFYLWKKLPFNHALWHVFVLLGSVLHFFAVWIYLLPGASR